MHKNKVNLLLENGLIKAGGKFDRELLVKVGYMPKYLHEISLLANGKPSAKFTYEVTKATKAAQTLVTESGGENFVPCFAGSSPLGLLPAKQGT